MTLSSDAKLVTFINVCTVEPANQQRLVDLLAHATVESVRQAPGFVSATLHRSLDGTKVTMYAQWRTIEDYQAMHRNPASGNFLQQEIRTADAALRVRLPVRLCNYFGAVRETTCLGVPVFAFSISRGGQF